MTNENLDRIGGEIVRRAQADDTITDAAAESPFLYARVRARIAAERARREVDPPFARLLIVARRAVPAMTLLATLAFGVFWFGGANEPSPSAFADDALFAAGNSADERALFAERDARSGDEAFDELFGDEFGASK